MSASSNHLNSHHVRIKEDVRKRVSSVSIAVSSLKESDAKKVIHSIKVGIALVLVSLLYLLNSMFKQVGENAMWAIMTVVVVFEFHAGATLSKGINRGIGTLTGGGLGCLAAILADNVGKTLSPIIVALSVFAFGACATYFRMVPRMKKRYDYGFMISILTFNLVVVSGVRADKVVELARDRLATIGMGFAICIFVSLFLYPMWAGDELHCSTASNFNKLATSIDGFLDAYFNVPNEKEDNGPMCSSGGSIDHVEACKSILNSKSRDESMANFAKWEPWHGKFGLNYPWEKYIVIGDHLRELAATLLLLHACLQSTKQPHPVQRQIMKEPCEIVMSSAGYVLRHLGESVEKMELCSTTSINQGEIIQSMKRKLIPMIFKSGETEADGQYLAVSSFIFLMMEIVEKVEKLAKTVKEMGELAEFEARKIDV